MDKIVEQILKHPIATIIIVVATANSVANVISAAKGKGVTPFVSVVHNKKD